MRETYVHHFPGAITATATVDGTLGQPEFHVEWSQFPPPKELIPEYLRWRQSFLADFGAKTGKKILVLDVARLNWP